MAEVKTCSTCRESLPKSMFHKQAANKDGLCCFCKSCKKKRKRVEYLANREIILAKCAAYKKANPEKVKESQKRSYAKKPEHYKSARASYYEENKEAILAYSAEYRAANKEAKSARDRAYVGRRMKVDPLFRLSYSVRNRIFVALRGKNFTKTSSTAQMLDCDFEFLQLFIEEQFLPGMAWEDRSAWHIDHRVPLASAKTSEEMVALCHFSNLRPMWATDNIRKGAKMDYHL